MLNGNGKSNRNGHANGKEKHHDRTPPSETRMLCSSILNGWLAEAKDPEKMKAAMAALVDVLEAPTTRPGTKALAAKALGELQIQMVTLGIRLAEFEDKIGRLDTGGPTERVETYTVEIPEARIRI